jgi:DNA-binding transcriptional regulator GbsR (MarR family)
MSISSESSSSRLISKSEFLSSFPPWRRLLAKLNWHPTIDAQIRVLESERRENVLKKQEQESERRTQLIENDIERLQKENKRLADIESRLDALLLSADSSSPAPPATESN